MRVTPRLGLVLLAGVALVSLGVVADTIPPGPIPTNFFLGNAPASAAKSAASAAPAATVEKSQAVNGTLYAVVAPTYNGTGGTTSYIRLFNGGAAAATFTITVVGSPSAFTYGVATYSIPSGASPQHSLQDILTAANAAALNDTSFSLYIQSTEATAGYQHVTFNSNNLFFENASSCNYALNHTIKSVVNSQVLLNVHTTLFPTYPSQVEMHNTWNATVTYKVYVREAKTGAIKGQISVPIKANTTYIQPMSYYQTAVGWSPAAGEFHANLVITDTAGIAPSVTLGQSIINQTVSNALVNMSTFCAVNAPVSTSSGGGGDGGGFGGGGISY